MTYIHKTNGCKHNLDLLINYLALIVWFIIVGEKGVERKSTYITCIYLYLIFCTHGLSNTHKEYNRNSFLVFESLDELTTDKVLAPTPT